VAILAISRTCTAERQSSPSSRIGRLYKVSYIAILLFHRNTPNPVIHRILTILPSPITYRFYT
jgi:hypothetical protein